MIVDKTISHVELISEEQTIRDDNMKFDLLVLSSCQHQQHILDHRQGWIGCKHHDLLQSRDRELDFLEDLVERPNHIHSILSMIHVRSEDL